MASSENTRRLSRWLKILQNPPQYVSASLIVSLGGLLNGLDTGTIGPVTAMPSFFDSFGIQSSSLTGLVVSSILLPATFASLFAGALSDSLGRTRAVAIGALFFAIGAALEASAVNLGMLIAGRCVVGTGEGLFLSTLVVYVCEISPTNKRGPLATMVQLFITMGLCVGFFTCYGTVRIPSSLSWRLPLALQSGIALILTIGAGFFLPQSPRWLAHKGRREEASIAWDKLGVSNAEREKDLLQNPTSTVNAGSNLSARPTEALKTGLRDRIRADLAALMSVFGKDSRKPMMLGVFLMSMQQLSGIDGVIYYAPLLFQEAGLSTSKATFLASGVSAILIFVFTILAVVFVDRWGRRASTIYGGLLMFACMAVMALLYSTDNVHATYGFGKWIAIATIYVFAIGYCMTWAIGVKLFASEIQPAATRATAISLAQSANCITNFFVAFITPVILSRSSSGIYFLFGGALILTVAVSMIYMPETRGRDLEAIGEAFGLQRTRDMPVIRRLKALGSRIGTMVGASNRSWGRITATGSQEMELENRL
ncbi:hypothetical protein MMC30_005595 [Trapelia coarctata]|nr:hypothetical protein [Trapelia coarctata]